MSSTAIPHSRSTSMIPSAGDGSLSCGEPVIRRGGWAALRFQERPSWAILYSEASWWWWRRSGHRSFWRHAHDPRHPPPPAPPSRCSPFSSSTSQSLHCRSSLGVTGRITRVLVWRGVSVGAAIIGPISGRVPVRDRQRRRRGLALAPAQTCRRHRVCRSGGARGIRDHRTRRGLERSRGNVAHPVRALRRPCNRRGHLGAVSMLGRPVRRFGRRRADQIAERRLTA